jgi:peptidoglycan/LPS O-acetylase OafA/YrhL
MLPKIDNSKILPLTSIRFFAAFYVLAYHIWPNLQFVTQGTFFLRFLNLGYVSVSFFFFLSGYVLAFSYLNSDKPIQIRRFFTARFARLYPLLVATMLLDLPHFAYTQIHIIHRTPGHLLAIAINSLGVLAAWFPNLGALDPPNWSVSTEIFFYLLFPFIGPPIWRMRGRSLWLLAAALYAAGTLLVLGLLHLHTDRYVLAYNPVTHLYEFALGICTAKLLLYLLADPVWKARLNRYSTALITSSALLFLCIPLFAIDIPETVLQHGLLLPLYAVVLLSFSAGRTRLTHLLSAKWLVILGESSFALYLIHFPLIAIFRKLFLRNEIVGTLIYTVVAIGLSIASFYWLETPSRRWIMRRAHLKNPENAATIALAQ